ncbi:MAG: PAS domain S-box protein [Pyrinomonadaceae bacterium]
MKSFSSMNESSDESYKASETASRWLRWPVAVLAVALVLAFRWLLWPALQEQAPLLLFTFAVMASAWYGGLGPGLLATFLSALAGKFFFIAPYNEIGFSDPRDGVRVGLFVLLGIVISYLSQTLHDMTRRAEAGALGSREHEAASRQSEERFRLLVEGVRDYAIFMMDTEGRITSWNLGAERLLGYKEAEVIGHKLHRIFTPEDIAGGKTEQELRTALETGRADDKRWHVRKDGSRFWADGVMTAIRDEAGNLRGLSKLMRDNTAMVQAEAELRESEERFRNLADNAPVMIWVTEPDASCTYLSKSWYKFTGQTPETGLGFGWLDATHPEDIESAKKIFLAANEKRKAFRLEYRLRCKDGSYAWTIDSAAPRFGPAGEFLGYIGSVIDITERKQAEEALIESEKMALLAADIGTALTRSDSLRDILQRCAETMVRHMDAAFARIWTLNEPENMLELQASAGIYTHRDGPHSRVPVGQFKIGLIAQERQPHLTNEVVGDPRVSDQEWARREGMVAFAGYPLIVEDRLVGVMAMFARHPLADEALAAMASVAKGIALGIERKRVEEAVRESEERFRFMAESMPQKIFTAKPNGEVDYFNRQWTDFTGLSFVQIRDWGWTQFIHPSDVAENVRVWQHSIDTGELFQFEHRFRRADGAWRWHLSRAHAMRDAEGNVLKWIGSNTDIDDQVRAGEERERLLAAEQTARAEAEQANRLKDEFLATVSHELRTPLTAILGWARMLQDNRLDASVIKSALNTIERNAQAQQQLIEDLMDVSRIITGKLRLNVRPVELVVVINSAIEAVRPAAEAKGIRLQPVLDPIASAVSGDPDRLQQIVWNLLSNAIKFTPKGGRVQVRLERINSHVEIVVSDTGQGICDEFLPYVFERFRQADASTTRKHGGLGLGLAIVRQLVEMHGGTVSVASGGEGRGATFTVKLPLMIVHHEPGDEKRRHPQAEEGIKIECPPELDGVRVLVVDDEPDARQLLTVVLERCGAKILTAASATEALRLLAEVRPDVLLSDIGMPGEDGYSLIRKVRALPAEQGGRTPAAALTAYASAEDRKRVLLAGFQLHIPKPVEPTELITVVASLAGRIGAEKK